MTLPLNDSLPGKLLQARKAAGLSARATADRLKRSTNGGVSYNTVIQYEKGVTRPSLGVLAGLAEVYERPVNWFLQTGPSLADVRYRDVKSRVRVADKNKFEGAAQKWFDAYIAIEHHLGVELVPTHDRADLAALDPIKAAEKVRADFNIASKDPLYSVMGLLEEYGVRTIEVETNAPISGLAARIGDDPVVAVASGASPDRTRLSAAHELGHVLLGHCDSVVEETKKMEKDAYAFASHLLMPTSTLKKAFEGKSMVRLVKFKEVFGISLAAMVFRAKEEEVIDERMAQRLFMEFSKRGWRKNEPGTVRADRAVRFEEMVDQAVIERDYTFGEIAAIGGVYETDLRHRVADATGLDGSITEEEEPIVENRGLRLVR